MWPFKDKPLPEPKSAQEFFVETYPLVGVSVAYKRVHLDGGYTVRSYLYREGSTGTIRLSGFLTQKSAERFQSPEAAQAFITEYLDQQANPEKVRRVTPYRPGD